MISRFNSRFLLVGLLGSAALLGCNDNQDRSVVVTRPTLQPVQVVAPLPREETLADRLSAAGSMSEAVAAVRTGMTDTKNELSPGAAVLALWAIPRMKLSDVLVDKDETTYGLTRKDPDEARGKRLCATGSIVQIEILHVAGDKFFRGLIISNGGSLFEFYAIGSTGGLVFRSHARVCGVVTGLYDYSNSGGTGHAVTIVGMFDLPENRKAAGIKPMTRYDEVE